jgi:UDP:flavonoid glycosyltransferase YjiC (YdhE family)
VELPPTALVIGHTPHGKLFPRCAAVIHHGGAGTTANAARAGVPQVLVPHFLDQFYWCHRVWKLGLSPPPIPRSLLHVEPLAAALRTCADDTALRERAREFATSVALDGLERTIRPESGPGVGESRTRRSRLPFPRSPVAPQTRRR